ncbi:hypothetical protein OsJ_04749 [Oryza sativa Japonica Group]|uniref:Uncharacterized protein n=1 Tax=Oryza sativa subsp. japonica TaxID=39947 RepID=A3A1H5_ORYSJ|nr:hypothetical protein OsJ_04749 [Oryza sativa Japonica Group]
MESVAVNAARWVVGKALSPLSGGFVEAWAATTELGPNVDAIKMELLYAQGMLHNARSRETSNPALQQLLLKLRGLAYDAEDVLDELDYFRIQDELDGTYEAAEEHAKGCLYGLVLNTRRTVRNIKKKACSCGDNGEASRHTNDGEALAGSSCIHKLFSNARERSQFLCCAYPCKASHIEHTMKTPKLKFDRVDLSTRMKHIVEQLKPVCAKVSTILNLELLESNRNIGLMSLNAALSRMPGQAPFLPSSVAMSRPVTTSEFIDPKFHGRMSEINKIIGITRGDYCGKDLTIIPIVGSEEIAKLMPELKDEKSGGPDDLIEQRLKSKRFLLVLDDMWNCGNEDEWRRLLAPLRKAQSTGNIILVTTRFLAVAEMVKTIDHSIQLEGLESEVFWELFQACVFGDEKSIGNHVDLLVTGKKIAEKLKGSPLAAKTVGRLLRNHLDLEHWTSVLESREWELQTGAHGVCYGVVGNNLPSRSEVVQLYKSKGISAMRIYYPDQEALAALRGSGIAVIVDVGDKGPGGQPRQQPLRRRRLGPEQRPGLLAERLHPNLYNALVSAGLSNSIKVSTAVKMDVITNSFPPSHGVFRPDLQRFIVPIAQFLANTMSPLLVNVYPYFAYRDNPRDIPLNYATFQPGTTVRDNDSGLTYTNLFSAMVDAVYAALEKAGAPGVRVVVSESGWPSAGGFAANVENARNHNQGVIDNVKNGTPKRPGQLETYVFAMFNENQKPGDETERHFGLFNPDKTPVYPITFPPN